MHDDDRRAPSLQELAQRLEVARFRQRLRRDDHRPIRVQMRANQLLVGLPFPPHGAHVELALEKQKRPQGVFEPSSSRLSSSASDPDFDDSYAPGDCLAVLPLPDPGDVAPGASSARARAVAEVLRRAGVAPDALVAVSPRRRGDDDDDRSSSSDDGFSESAVRSRSFTASAVAIVDHDATVTSVFLTDLDLDLRELAGTLTWDPPASPHVGLVEGYAWDLHFAHLRWSTSVYPDQARRHGFKTDRARAFVCFGLSHVRHP